MFRLMELDAGRIVIDGIDISRLGVHQLRSRMAIIPQVNDARLHSLVSSKRSFSVRAHQNGIGLITRASTRSLRLYMCSR